MEKDNPHDPEQVTLKQRIKQYVEEDDFMANCRSY